MTPETFKVLPLQLKVESLWNEGHLIETRTSYPDLYYQLYRMRGFYAELACNVETDRIMDIRVLKKEEAMKMYSAFGKVKNLHPC